MAKQVTGWKRTKGSYQNAQRIKRLIMVLVVAIFVLAVGLVIYRVQAQPAFSIQAGDRELLILLRNDQEGFYRLKYDGSRPIELQSLKVMLHGQIIHLDVQQVAIVVDGEQVILARDGSLPEGRQVALQPGDTLEVRVTYRGQTVGGNYLYGFRIGYESGGRTGTYDLELKYDYALIVR
jgi:hypothetical protein